MHLDDRGLTVPQRRPRIPDAPTTVGHVLDRPTADAPHAEALIPLLRSITNEIQEREDASPVWKPIAVIAARTADGALVSNYTVGGDSPPGKARTV